jgi:TolB protein
MDLGSRHSTQITKHFAIDTEPVWTPDGQNLIFTSDRSGKAQIYQAPAAGGDATRITFQGESNARASVSYDGKKIAVAQGNGNVYRIAVLDRATGEAKPVSVGNLDESPSFAPNASMILYAATDARRTYAVSANGLVRQRLVLADGVYANRPGHRIVSVDTPADGKLPKTPSPFGNDRGATETPIRMP